MHNYRFVLYSGDAPAEELGAIALRDDADARSFAMGVIGDLQQTGAADWTLHITEDERAVASIPFHP
jgi:hypothetical protein